MEKIEFWIIIANIYKSLLERNSQYRMARNNLRPKVLEQTQTGRKSSGKESEKVQQNETHRIGMLKRDGTEEGEYVLSVKENNMGGCCQGRRIRNEQIGRE
jgi:hypothetical protein